MMHNHLWAEEALNGNGETSKGDVKVLKGE